MTNKPTKPIKQVPPRTLSEQEKQARIMQFLQQRRESFSINILCSLLQNNPGVHPEDVVTKAVDLADNLIKKLYPMEEESK
jgi:hypothetical protein